MCARLEMKLACPRNHSEFCPIEIDGGCRSRTWLDFTKTRRLKTNGATRAVGLACFCSEEKENAEEGSVIRERGTTQSSEERSVYDLKNCAFSVSSHPKRYPLATSAWLDCFRYLSVLRGKPKSVPRLSAIDWMLRPMKAHTLECRARTSCYLLELRTMALDNATLDIFQSTR